MSKMPDAGGGGQYLSIRCRMRLPHLSLMLRWLPSVQVSSASHCDASKEVMQDVGARARWLMLMLLMLKSNG